MSGTGLSQLPGDAARHVESVWGAAVDPKAISQSVQNIWEQNSAQAEIAKTLMSGGRHLFPWENQQQLGQQMAGVYGAALPQTANPLNVVGAGAGRGAYGVAAVALPSLLQALSSTDPHEQGSALIWAAMTGMLMGKVPEPMRKQLGEAFGNWPKLERTLGAIQSAKQKFARSQGAGDTKPIEDMVQHYMNLGGFPGADHIMAKAPRGEFSVGAKLQKAMLAKAGVKSMPDFMAKAAEEGITDKRLIKFIVDNYPKLGFTHDLHRINPGDVALGDPRTMLRQIEQAGDPVRTGWAADSMNAFAGLLGHVHSGLWADETDPALAILKNLAGHNRTNGSTDLIFGRWMDSVKQLQKMHGLNGTQISKAIWGDKEAFDALPEEGRMLAQQWRLLGNSLMHEGKAVGMKDFTGNWLPIKFAEKAAKAAKAGSGALATENKAHKIEALRAESPDSLIGLPQFPHAFAANEAQALRRSNLVNELVTPQIPLRNELAKVAAAKSIRDMAVSDPEAAYKAARDFAKGYYGDFETDFFKIADGWKAIGLKDIRTRQALHHFSEMLGENGNPLAVPSVRSHQFPEYQRLNGRRFDGWLFHPELHPHLQRYVEHPAHGVRGAPGLRELRQIENKSVSYIMYSPLIHAMNLAGRVATGWAMNPIEMTHYLLNGRAMSPVQRDLESNRLRAEAIEAGFVPPTQGKSWMDHFNSQANSALGDVDQTLDHTPPNSEANLFERYKHAHQALNDFFWSSARDFGTMMYHIEKQGALKHGFSETDARMYAAQRAKTWVGLTNPEDHNQNLHDAARLVMFAPEWWKSWAQLIAPVYRNSGMSERHAGYAAYQGLKFVTAFLAMQKVTGNLLNFALTSSTPWAFDGHFQNQNLPGNQDRIEATGSWVDHLPGLGGVPADNPKTGGRRTLENPLARQMRDTEMAMGLQSGHPDWQPQDLWDGMTKVAVARLAPLMDGAAAAGNMDLYRSVTTGSWAHVNPNAPAGLSMMSPVYAALMMTPAGSQWAEQMAAAGPQTAQGVIEQGPFGAKTQKGAQQMLSATKDAVSKTLFSWLTGVNAPYDYAAKSRGTPVSDEGYAKYQTAKSTYEQQMTQFDSAAASGQMTPSQWLQKYHEAHSTYSAVSKSVFQNAPHYTGGAEGMAGAYEAIYDDPKVKNPDGSVNYDLVQQEQAKFRSEYTPTQLSQMDALIQQNDTKHPMLALYHKTLNEYHQWQDQWASQHHVDMSQLRQEISEYGALYGDKRESTHYLSQHRELAMYEAAKRTQWERTPAGLMYGLFYNSSSVSRYMAARHLSAQQVEQEVEAGSA